MSMLVHLTDERLAARVRRGGIIGGRARIASVDGKEDLRKAVYCMPVLPSFYASHQWLRELKNGGMRTIVSVYFRLRTDAQVWVGHFNQHNTRMTLGQATGVIMRAADPMGFQIIVPASIDARAIHSIRKVPQVVGWRHFPDSHGQRPWKCLCDFCLQSQKGQIKARRLRQALLAEHSSDDLNIEGDPKKLI